MIYRIILTSIITFSYIGLASAFEASYYSDAFEGGTSSNGTIFSQTQHTAAICYEELSQLAYISTAQTGMVVTLTDRPNCTRHDDRIDLSSSVFSVFAPLSKGLIKEISAVPLGIKTGKFVKRNISRKEFSDYSVELLSPIANIFIAGETIKIQGRVLDSKRQVAVFLKNKNSSEENTYSYLVGANNVFDISLTLPGDTGEYFFKILSISPGEELTIKDFVSIFIVDDSIKDLYPYLTPAKLISFPIHQSTILTDKIVTVDLRKNIWGQFSLTQGRNIFNTDGQVFSFSGMNLSLGQASYIFTGYTLSSPSSLDISPAATHSSSGVVRIDRTRRPTGDGTVSIKKVGKTANFKFRVNKGFLAMPDYYVTLPNGDVREYSIHKKFIDANGYIKVNTLVTGSFPIPDKGTYRFEVNQDSGIAYINVPFYTEFTLPIIEQKLTLPEGRTYEIAILDEMNTIRRSLGRKALLIDADLSKVATLKAKDMYTTKASSRLGVSHTNSKGKDIQSFARFYSVTRNILGENVAGSNNPTSTAILELHDGLEESPGHRNNIVSPNFSKVGIGYYQNGRYSYLVHVFSN